ncbi:MAG: universal stress protein [Chloroflexota bacterium]|nr:universal stress protein [Chloroflexota bacterium]
MFKRILVCLDSSSLAEQILPYASEIALRSSCEMVLLEVVSAVSSVGVAIPGVEPVPIASDILSDRIEKEKQEAIAYLENVAQPLREKGLSVESVALQGLPGDAIVAYAQENQIDVVAIATHGRSGLGRLVFGSVAEHVLKESGLPILLIKPKETTE